MTIVAFEKEVYKRLFSKTIVTVKKITFWNGNLIYVIRNVSFTFDFKKLLENELRFVTGVVLEYFAMLEV